MAIPDFMSVAHVDKCAAREPMMSRSLPVNDLSGEGVFSVKLEGPVNMFTVPRIRKTLLAFTKRNEITEMHVDFSQVSALDTAGIAMLVEVWRGLVSRRAVLRLAGLSEQARRLIQLARLDQVFEV
jgi:anti-sigma B factor antagonist